MAAPSLAQVSDPATDAGGTWGALLFPTPVTPGNLIIVQMLQDGATSGAVTTPTGWSAAEKLDGTSGDMDYLGAFQVGGTPLALQHLWIGRAESATSFWGPGAGGGNSTSEDLYYRAYEFADVSDGTTLAEVIENVTGSSVLTSTGSNNTITDASVTTTGPDRLALQFVAINDDNALGSFTGETGGNWAALAEYAESSGTDGAIQVQAATIASAGTIDGGSFTMAASDAWGVIGFALIGTTPSGPADQTEQMSALSSAGAFGAPSILPGGVSVSLSALASAGAFGTASALPGGVEAAVSALASAGAFGTPTAVVQTIAQVSALASAGAFGSVSALPGGVDVSVAALASAAQLGTASAIPGAVTAAVSALASAGAFGAPTAESLTSVQVSALTSAGAFGSVLALAGGVDVPVSALASASALGDPTIHAAITQAVSALASAAVFGSVTAVPGGIAAAPSGLASAADIGVLSVLVGPVTVPMSALASAVAFGTAEASGSGADPQIEVVQALASAGAFGALTAVPGAITETVSALASAGAFGSPGYATGPTVVAVGGLDTAAVFGVPEADLVVFVSGLGSAGAFGVPMYSVGPTTIAVVALGSASQLPAVGTSGGSAPTFIPAIHGGRHK